MFKFILLAYPFFYIDHYTDTKSLITLNEVNSKHIVQVLRMQNDETIHLTDGLGNLLKAVIRDNHKKHCVVEVMTVDFFPQTSKVNIAIALIKNNSRFEWFLEKATEIGIANIFPVITQRTEKVNFKFERLQTILVSAMLQSQQTWLPVLHTPVSFNQFIQSSDFKNHDKLIAHCASGVKHAVLPSAAEKLMLIGPEGDFTDDEIATALNHTFQPVTLGNTRLRTETAAVVATVLLNQLLIK